MSKKDLSDEGRTRTKEVRSYDQMAQKHLLGLEGEAYKILRMEDVKKEWNFIITRIDEYLKEKEKPDAPRTTETYTEELKNRIYSKVVVHFYHDPKDTEDAFVLGNKEFIQRGFKILWVYNSKKRSTFESELTERMGRKILKNCSFLEMDEVLELVPINFTVIAPHEPTLALVYVRFDELDFGIRIEQPGETVSLFNDLGSYCIEKATPPGGEQKWIPQ